MQLCKSESFRVKISCINAICDLVFRVGLIGCVDTVDTTLHELLDWLVPFVPERIDSTSPPLAIQPQHDWLAVHLFRPFKCGTGRTQG